MLVEGIAGVEHFEIADIQLAGNLEDLDLDRVAFGGEGIAVTEHHRDIALPLARGRERITIDCGIATENRRHCSWADIDVLIRIDDVVAQLGGVWAERFQTGG